ncbi:MAG: signal peptidase II [Myxococcales bacterium]|nr:signal peptidase II [Myxococcales bacterium]
MRRSLFLVVVLLAAGCDQGSKWLAVEALTEVDSLSGFLVEQHPVVVRELVVHPDYFHLRYAENTGMAFSLLSEVPQGRALLLVSGSLGMLLVLGLAWRIRDRWALLGCALICGGGIGNLLDRARLGYVIDFVSWHYREQFVWPTFNVADALLLVGGVLLALRWDRTDGPWPRMGTRLGS